MMEGTIGGGGKLDQSLVISNSCLMLQAIIPSLALHNNVFGCLLALLIVPVIQQCITLAGSLSPHISSHMSKTRVNILC